MSDTTIYYTPFTYRLTWSKYGISYYGAKYSKDCHPSDLWTKYFTSSKYVKEFRKLYGEPDIRKVTKTFSDVESCLFHENRVLNRINARDNPKMLNKSNPNSYGKSIFKNKNLPGNSGPKGIIENHLKHLCVKLGLEYSNKPPGLKGRYWVNYNNIVTLYFLDESDRTHFLSVNKDWSLGRNTLESKEKTSRKLKGISKPTRTIEHKENIGKSNKGKSKPGSGPKDMKTYHNHDSEIRLPKHILPPEGYLPGRIPGKYGNKSFGSDMLKFK